MKSTCILFLILTLAACGGSKKSTVEKTEKQSVKNSFIVSQGGGISGKHEAYLVKVDGQVFALSEVATDTTKFGVLNKTSMTAINQKLALINTQQMPKGGPGNMNYTLVIFKENTSFMAHWADANTPKKSIFDFYEYAFSEIKKIKK